MAQLTENSHLALRSEAAPGGKWEYTSLRWPRKDVNGCWLVFTDALRRRLADGSYEYRSDLAAQDVYA